MNGIIYLERGDCGWCRDRETAPIASASASMFHFDWIDGSIRSTIETPI